MNNRLTPRFNMYLLSAAFAAYLLYGFYSEYFSNGGNDPVVLVVATLVLGGVLAFTGIHLLIMWRQMKKEQAEEEAQKAAQKQAEETQE